MKTKVIASLLLVLLCLSATACTLQTPMGTFTMNYDADQKSDKVLFTDDTGNTKTINTDDLNGEIDSLLNDVDLPQGATTEDLKNFVNGTSESLGVQDSIDGIQDDLDSVQEGITDPADVSDLEEPLVDGDNVQDGLSDILGD